MTLLNLFFKNITDFKTPEARSKAGFISGMFGIVINLFLFVVKFLVGFITGSIAITADSFNNLSDMCASFIPLLGFKLANKKADQDHPFGHGRLEYVSGLIISFLIIIVGFEFAKSSFEKILNPQPITLSVVSVIILALTVPVKLYLAWVYTAIGKKINSSVLFAAATDSRNDALATAVITVSVLVGFYGNFLIDGYSGLLVSLYILYSGFRSANETLSPLLGTPPSAEIISEIERRILSAEGVCGIHDLIVHDYGPNKYIASAHAEVPADVDLLKIHDTIDTVEREIFEQMGEIIMTIHLDPIETKDDVTNSLKEIMDGILSEIDPCLSFHDFRVVKGETHTKLIFDIVVPLKYSVSNDKLKEEIDIRLQEQCPNCYTVIVFDRKLS